jgi:hypothetical protein
MRQVESISSDGRPLIIPRPKNGFFSFSAGGRIVVTYCGFLSVYIRFAPQIYIRFAPQIATRLTLAPPQVRVHGE